MFDFDSSGGVESLELGSRRRPVKWAVELSLADCRPQKHKARKRQQGPGPDSAPGDPQPAAEQPQHAQAQQQAQAQRIAAHRKHLEQLVLSQEQDPEGVTPAQAKYKKEFRDARVVCLSTEIEQGNVEYKYRLTGCVTNENRRHQLVTQMKFRLSEGSGECFYYLGVEDDGYPRGLEPQELRDSIAVINRMAISLQATARLVEFVPGGFGRTAALLHIKADAEEDMRATDSRVAVAGSMDSGKSTLVAVLTHGADGRPLLDNGRGSARMAVFRHKHEIESGRTSSISQQVLGYDEEGRVLNYVGVATPTPADITAAASHIVNFIDMGGHEKYLKTTLYGMTCLLPDYALLCVDAATGVTRITREHLAVAVALEVPTALVVTKADAVDDHQLQQVLQQLHQLMAPVLHNFGQPEPAHQQQSRQQQDEDAASSSSSSSSGDATEADSSASCGSSRSGVPLVESEAQAVSLAAGLSELHSCTAAPAAPSFQQAVFPVFVVSCVSGAGVPLLHAFLAHLKPLQKHKQAGSSSRGSSSNAAGTNGVVQADQAAACSAVDRSAEAAARPAPNQQQQQQQVTAGGKPSSSQLWVVSPKKHPPGSTPVSPVLQTAAAAAAPVPGLSPAPAAPEVQQAAAAADGVAGLGAGDDESSGRPGHFQVVHTYDVEGVGWVVSGIAVTGTVEVGQSLLWGPTPEGGFSPVRVTCIQRSHVPVRQIAPGQTATLALQSTAPGLPHSGSKQALLTAAAVAQAAAAEAAAREAAAAIAAVPEPTAKTRRRSPAALKAAAAAAAHTAAAAAAAADAARRAASTVGGQAWWVHEPQASSFSSACTATAQEAPFLATGGQNGAQQQQECTAAMPAAAAADSVADFLDDDFAARLAADDGSGSDSEGDTFGAALEQLQQPQQQQCRRVPASGMPVVAAAATAAVAGPAGGALGLEQQQQEEEEDMFAGLEGVFDAADGQEEASPGGRSSSSGSSSSSGLANSWSFSSASSSGGQCGSAARGAAGACSRPVPAPAAGGVAVSVPGGARNLSMLSHSSSEQLLGCSPSRWRTKGGVLLDAGAAPHTYWEFEALLVLLGGFWPARGLLSGSWPPAGEETPAAADTVEAAQSRAAAAAAAEGVDSTHAGDSLCQQVQEGEDLEADSAQQAQRRGRKQRRGSKRYEFTYVVHCNSIRQTARVVSMQELRSRCEDAAGDSPENAGLQQQQQQQDDLQHHCGLTVSIRAAAALLQGASAVHSDREGSSGCASGDSSGDGNRRPRQRRLGGTAASAAAAGGAAGGSGANRRASDAGSVVAVKLRFTHRPEWLQVGARLIVRDRSDGHVAAAGFVTQLLAPHTQLQQHQRQ